MLVTIGFVAFFVAGLTLFSGFGLGTILTPVFVIFFPIPLAIAATAIVHFANNIFKFGLMAKQADWNVIMRFGLPAAIAALIGASLLNWLDQMPILGRYMISGYVFEVTLMKVVIGLLIIIFALLEQGSRFQSMRFDIRWLPFGGVLSGFFGGLSGNQGALRSAFLLKTGLSKEAFVATGVVSAVIVDASRLLIYGTGFMTQHFKQSHEVMVPVLVATVCAFLGSYIGKKLLHKITFPLIQKIVALMMLAIGFGLVAGLI